MSHKTKPSRFPPIILSSVYGVAIPNTEGKAGMAAIKLDQSIKFDLDELSQFVLSSLPRYSIPVFIRIIEEVETTTSSFKIVKTNLRKETYDLNLVKDPIRFWDSSTKKYVPLTETLNQKIKEGKFGELRNIVIPT